MIVARSESRQFAYIEEWEETDIQRAGGHLRHAVLEFLQLFPHRYDYIWARHPYVGTKPEWQTESSHPLADRLLLQGSYLYGVRFGTSTNYLMLDLDITSPYHPQQDPFAIERICNALEPLGLNSHIAITSSYSEGIHLYFPFAEAQKSYELAIAATTLIENAGYQIAPGILETFPNPKPYTRRTPNNSEETSELVSSEGQSLYNAHRLPLQVGSYLLDRDYQPTFGDARTFVSQWKFAQHKNHIDRRQLTRILKQYQRKAYKVSGKASKFLNDLNAEIEAGWTGSGQTNHILGRIAMREYIFRHALNGGKPLSGKELEEAIKEIAQSLPGYEEFCQHRHELPQKAEYWARSVEASAYYPYGHHKHQKAATVINSDLLEKRNGVLWNQQQQQRAEQRITFAIADLLNNSALPSNAKARCIAICSYGISASTLYKHKNLWHPAHLLDTTNNVPERPEKARETLPEKALQPIEDSSDPSDSLETLPEKALQPIEDNKLGGVLEGDALQGNPPLNPLLELGGCGGISTGFPPDSDGVAAALEETTANTPETEVTETEKRHSVCSKAADPRHPQSTEDRDEADINLQMAENAKNEGSILDIYFSSLHKCTCVVLPNRDIQPIDAWARSRSQPEPKPDPARELAGLELARQEIAKILAKQAALKREKFRQWWRESGG